MQKVQRKKIALAAVSRRLKPMETGSVGVCRASGISGGAEVGGDGGRIRFSIVTKLPS
jgi:hypothetical protein